MSVYLNSLIYVALKSVSGQIHVVLKAVANVILQRILTSPPSKVFQIIPHPGRHLG